MELQNDCEINHNGSRHDLFSGGLPKAPDGWSVNRLSIELRLDRRTVTKRLQGVEPLSDGPKGPLYALAEAVRALFGQGVRQVEDLNRQILRNKLEASEIDLASKRGELLPRKEVERAATNTARQEREAWLTWPARTAPILAGEFEVDQAKLTAALEREVRVHMEELTDEPQAA